MLKGTIPPEAVSVVLHGIQGEDDLIACEVVTFDRGAAAIDTVMRRAAISGRVEVGGTLVRYFADLLDARENLIESVALDARSYAALKNRWMRCKLAQQS